MWRVHTCVLAEKFAIPTVTIGTAAFYETGRNIAVAQGLPQLPIVVIPHPFDTLTDDEVRATADQVLPEVVAALTSR